MDKLGILILLWTSAVVTVIFGKYVTINGTSGTLSSLNYPNYYRNYMNDQWTIVVPNGDYIAISIHDFDIERGYDKFTIYDGSGKRVHYFTDSLSQVPISAPVFGRTARISFTTDYSVIRRGWYLEWSATIPCPDSSKLCSFDATCGYSNITDTYDCQCKKGFGLLHHLCTDIDECAMGIDNCSENALCTNIAGSFKCTCKLNFSGNGVTCV